MKSKDKKLVALRIDQDLYKKILQLAKDENRNFSNMTETILKKTIYNWNNENFYL